MGLGVTSLSDRERSIVQALAGARETMISRLRELVEIPTPTGDAQGLGRARDTCSRWLASLGASLDVLPGDPAPDWLPGASAAGGNVDRGDVVVARRPGHHRTRVLIVGHLDTVHPREGPFQGLTIDADGQRARGPGCMDMKGGLVVALSALQALHAAAPEVGWTVALNADEETGSFKSDRVLRSLASDHDFGLIHEPALPDGALVVERPGSGTFMLEARGKSAHVGRDFSKGVSAIAALCQRVGECVRLADPASGRIVSVGIIKGGTATNIVPDHAVAWGNVRFTTTKAEQDLAKALDAMAVPAGGATVSVRRVFSRPTKPRTQATNTLADLAARCARDLGRSLPFGVTGGVCDGNNLQAAGLATIDTLGVLGGGAHTTDEWVDLASLVWRAQLTALLIHRLAAPAS